MWKLTARPYQEMHVDGGVITQVFLYPSRILPELAKATGTPLQRVVHAYVIRNGRLEPEWSETSRRTLSVDCRAIGSPIETQGIGDIHRIYETARQDRINLNPAYIGTDFDAKPHARFDTVYMKRLFDYGYQAAARGYTWQKALPSEPSPNDK